MTLPDAPCLTHEDALAMLAWQVEMGVTCPIGDEPINRYEAAPPPPMAGMGTTSNIRPVSMARAMPEVEKAAPDIARIMADRADTLCALRKAMDSFDHCALKKGARNLVFADGNPTARVMIVGEGPGRDEDVQGKPFVGRAGQMLDRMFAAIGLSREKDGADALYITNVVPWRPPQNRDPEPDEIAMMLPFLQRHIALAVPDILVPMGNIACQALLGRKGITRLRGKWVEVQGRLTLPMLHPAFVLRDPIRKRDCWTDLLTLKARLP